MKNRKSAIVFLVTLTFMSIMTFAQVSTNGTNSVPVPPGELPNVADAVGPRFFEAIIAFLTPLFIWGVTKIVPKIPVQLLAVSSLVVGPVIEWALSLTGLQNIPFWNAALVGAAGVMIREAWNQNVTKRLGLEKPSE